MFQLFKLLKSRLHLFLPLLIRIGLVASVQSNCADAEL